MRPEPHSGFIFKANLNIISYMKKFFPCLLVALTALCSAFPASAFCREECGEPRGRFTNIAFVYSKMSQGEMPKIHSDIGVAFTKGNTYYLHKPIAGMLRFGIDAVWTDISYANYKVNQYTPSYSSPSGFDLYDYSIHQVDLGLQAGLSATVNLFRRFQASAYFRYNPCLQVLSNDGEVQPGFANMFVGGVSVSYSFIGLGIESRFGRCKAKTYFNPDDIDENWSGFSGSDKVTTKLSGIRAYLSIRF